jgi:outer membrane protein assembly factor BamB
MMRLRRDPARATLAALIVLTACGSAVPFRQAATADDAAAQPNGAAAPAGPSPAIASPDWPSFRGPRASGVADGQNLPDRWDGDSGLNIAWKRRIPGLAHSSPVIRGDRLYLTSAVSSRPDATFRHGLYGDGDASEDRTVHRFMVYALDKKSGDIIWERAAHEGVPKDKRHIKATYANATPAADGRYIVAWFGSEGLFAFDVEGRLLWRRDLGRLDVGAYDAPEYEWGPASSPIIHEGIVIVQCDTQGDSFLMAFDIATGDTAWKTMRDELPSWGTPTIYPGGERTELITNGSNFIRGYDPRSGRELWRLGGSSKITAPTPIGHDGLIVVASGRAPERPIFAIRAGASGNITLQAGATANRSVAWSRLRRGPYMPTPIIYGGRLYVLGNRGELDSYDLGSGEEIYRQQLRHGGGGFSASPVAADGKLYLPGEDGDIYVVRAGDRFELIATNPMGELLMASPALSDGMLYIRAEKHLFAIGR